MSKIPQELFDDIYLAESYLVGLFWSNTDYYANYNEDKITHKTFGNRIWSYYFYVGRQLYNTGKRIFDDITVEEYMSKAGSPKNNYAEFGEYITISEIMSEVRDRHDNFDGYYDDVKKYTLVRELHGMLGDKVIEQNGKYNYKKLNSEQIGRYWQEILNSKLINCDSKIEEFNLLEGLDVLIDSLDINPDMGMHFYNSKELTKLCCGWDYGEIYLFSAFSGKGKTSFTMNKLVMACIEQKEKLLIIANEMGIREYQKLLLITVMGNEMYEWYKANNLKSFHRQNINKGNFSDEDKIKLKQAVKVIKDLIGDDNSLVKLVPLENYTISNVERTIRYYANRGYKRMIVDTCKPTTDKGGMDRWQRFVEDFDKLYSLVRKNGGGLNIALWATLQLADTSVRSKYLDESCLGDSKKIKNVCSVVFHARSVHDNEYSGGKNEIQVYSYKKSPGVPKGYEMQKFTLEKSDDHQYILVFTSKNRRGQSMDTGLDVLVYKANFAYNTWVEVGFTKIFKDF